MAYTLLIADDEEEIRHGLKTYFPWQQIGFEVVAEAETGQQALDILTTRAVDVLLCDIRMPDKTGLDVARILHERGSGTTVVILSAYRDFEYARTAMSYGVSHYVLKSTRYQEMVDVFERIRQGLDAARGTAREAETLGYYEAMRQTLTRYVMENLATATLDGAASCIGKSVSFTSRFFKEQEGRQFGEYLQEKRMFRAAKLLLDYRLKTYQVSESVGYATPKSFTRAFRQRFGLSPQEYRRAAGSEKGENP